MNAMTHATWEAPLQAVGELVLRGYPVWLFRCFAAAYALVAVATVAMLWPA